MNEVEKMYRNSGIKKIELDYPDNFEPFYPEFTAEKQLELIKWLGKNKNGFNVFYDTGFNGKEKHYWCCANQCYEDFNYSCHKKEFSEALAGLINELLLIDAERKQIKEILSE